MSKFCATIMLTLASLLSVNSTSGDEPELPLSLVVMDPLAAPLSCPCVEGYAQRKYEVLAKHLQSSLGRKVKLTFADSLKLALKKSGGRVDILIGKQSVALADAAAAKIEVTAISRLTDRQGSTDQCGMIVVNKDDPAMSVDDLVGYTIIFGPAESEEKHAAALHLLSEAGITIPPDKQEIDLACSDGACKVIDLGPDSETAAVISSYAQPLLEGCGTIKKGDLRVVGKTSPVPFVTVFVSSTVVKDERAQVQSALASVALHPDVLEALESLAGFLPVEKSVAVDEKPAVKKN